MRSDDIPDTLDRKAETLRTPLALDDQLGYHVRRAHQHFNSLFQQIMPVDDLTPPQYNVLTRLREHGRVSQNQLGRLVDMDPATTQGVVKRLVERGLIERVADEVDRRRKQLSLTETGHQTMLVAMVAGQDVQERAFTHFDSSEREELLRLLVKLAR